MLNRADRSGFTLLELVITMSLLAVVTAMGSTRLSGELRRRTTQIAIDQFATAHSLARSTAVRYGRIAQLHIDAPTRRFWVDVDTTGNGAGQRAIIWYVRDLTQPGLVMTSNRSLLCFDARGMPSTNPPCESADAQIIFTAADKADTLTTATLGKILR
jgi:prepilin-type N-terminal cleavage/methylation domain-containing protein